MDPQGPSRGGRRGCRVQVRQVAQSFGNHVGDSVAVCPGVGFRGLGFRVPRVLSLGFRTFFDRLAEGCP